jgi:hypothetical protein
VTHLASSAPLLEDVLLAVDEALSVRDDHDCDDDRGCGAGTTSASA